MSAAKNAATAETKLEYRAAGGWANAWKIAAALGVLGLAGAGAGWASDPRRFAFSYMFAFWVFLSVALGALVFVLIQYLTVANWSVTVRRSAEFFMAGLPVFAVLFIPIAMNMTALFPWHHPGHGQGHGGEHASSHGEPGGHGDRHGSPHTGRDHTGSGHVEQHQAHPSEHADTPHPHAQPHAAPAAHGDPHNPMGYPDGFRTPSHAWHEQETEHAEHEAHARVIGAKRSFLNTTFFAIRAVLYFLIWSFLAVRLFGLSTRQDETRDPQNTVAAQRFAPIGTALFALTSTFAAFDWLMSLNPTWYSTIFGVWIFAGAILAIHATLVLVTMGLRRAGLLGESVNIEHYHDLGKLTFGFTVFWAYISFSQFFLIWYASIPEETSFFHMRWADGPWKPVSLFLAVGRFAIPFLYLLSRNIKRRYGLVAVGAAMQVVTHVVDMYWIVMPNYNPTNDPRGYLTLHWMDVACLVGVGGVYLALVFFRMAKHRLIPVGDPRLARSLAFENA